MNTYVRRPLMVNPEAIASLLGGAVEHGRRAFEHVTTPYRMATEGNSKVLSMDLAGFSKENIEVAVDENENTLSIVAAVASAEDESAEQNEAHGFYNRKVDLKFALPERVDLDNITSQYVDGVLKVVLPIKEIEKVEARKIAVS